MSSRFPILIADDPEAGCLLSSFLWMTSREDWRWSTEELITTAAPRLCSGHMSVLDFTGGREGGKEADEKKEEESSYLSLEAGGSFHYRLSWRPSGPAPVHPGCPLQHLFTVP